MEVEFQCGQSGFRPWTLNSSELNHTHVQGKEKSEIKLTKMLKGKRVIFKLSSIGLCITHFLKHMYMYMYMHVCIYIYNKKIYVLEIILAKAFRRSLV